MNRSASKIVDHTIVCYSYLSFFFVDCKVGILLIKRVMYPLCRDFNSGTSLIEINDFRAY